ncbi:hypothetical protein [Streptomyces sp. NPDC058683]|uniref:hypothetical protein n=1 Tax=Streptomyces sp. NPDC058683 TaxID=3346597 RepID=UPI00364EA09C
MVLVVAPGVRVRGGRLFLHTSARSTDVVRLYKSLGLRLRDCRAFLAARVAERARQR